MKRVIAIASLIFVSAMFCTGCVEHRYYVQHHDHSPHYYAHHPHRHPRVEVDIRN